MFEIVRSIIVKNVFNNKSDSGILEIQTSPISVDNFGSRSEFSTIIVSVNIPLTYAEITDAFS